MGSFAATTSGAKANKHIEFSAAWTQEGFNQTGIVEDAKNVISGHSKNYIVSDVHSSTIAGGGLINKENVIGGIAANVGTETSNVPNTPILNTVSQFCLIGGGYDNVVNGLANMITVGQHCVIDLPADHGSIHGGSNNKVLNGSYNSIVGGSRNTMHSDGYSVISGGGDNWVGTANTYTTISGGSLNQNYASFSVVAGGQNNAIQATSPTSVVSGGAANKTEQPNSTISGGNGNTINPTGQGSVVSGGIQNVASGECSIVHGGRENQALENYSQVSGYQGKVGRVGQEVLSNGKFFLLGDAQTSRILLKGNTSGFEEKNMVDLAGGSSFPINTNIAIGYKIRLVGHAIGVENENVMIILEGMATRGSSGLWVITSFADKLVSTAALLTATAKVFDSVGSLRVSAKGVAGYSLNWVAFVEFTENKG